ncbi:MAG TPA: hypothetical protein DIU14_00070, partial [Actinobacteria bacterium]|nr:hypothetical protein [Actinomycetota bacterium]
MSIDARLRELGIELPSAARPLASYVPVSVSGGFAFVSGQVPLDEGKVMVVGKLGDGVSLEEGQAATRRCALQALAALR